MRHPLSPTHTCWQGRLCRPSGTEHLRGSSSAGKEKKGRMIGMAGNAAVSTSRCTLSKSSSNMSRCSAAVAQHLLAVLWPRELV